MSETSARLKTRLLIGFLVIVSCVQFGLTLFYLFFSLDLNDSHLAGAFAYFLLAAPLASGLFSIYLPLRAFRADLSYPATVAKYNAAGVSLFYLGAIFLALRAGYPAEEAAKILLLGLSAGLLDGLWSFMFTLENIYPHLETGLETGAHGSGGSANSAGSGRWMSLYLKNLAFILSVVFIGVVVVGSVIFNTFEQSIPGHVFIGHSLVKILFACLVASAIAIVLSTKFTNLVKLPLRELTSSVKAVSEGMVCNAKAVTGDELEDLIGSFNVMSEKVREREDELLLRGQQLALLYSFAEALNQNKNTKELFDLTMDWLDATFGLEVGTLRLIKDGSLKLEASKGLGEEDVRRIDTLKLEDSLAGLAVLQDDTLAIEDLSAFSSPHAATALNMGLKSIICMPLRCGGAFVGTLSAASREKRDFYYQNVYLLSSLSNLLGVALERSRQFDLVEEEKFQWETAIGHIKDVISIHDSQWRIKNVNPAFLEYFGCREEDVIGRHCFEVFHGTNTPPHECPNIEAMLTRRKSTSTVELGREKLFSVSVHPIFKKHGAVDGCIHIAKDITEVVRLRERIHQADKLGALGRLTSGIAHDVNNPLTYSLNYLFILKESTGDEKAVSLIKKAEQGIEKAKSVLGRLLEFSGPSEGPREAVDLGEAVGETSAFLSGAMAGTMANKPVAIRTEFTEKIKVLASKKSLEEVLMNLVTNSVDAGATEVVIEGYSDPKYANITVTDNGSGIDSEHIPRLFEPYFTTKPVGKGTGLGLYVSYNLVKSMGGNIWCGSKKGSGTQFSIVLPLA